MSWGLLVLVLLVVVTSQGCMTLDAGLCTPKDTSYGCCLKMHPENPQVCGSPTGEVTAAADRGTAGGTASLGRIIAAAAGLAAVLESDDLDRLAELQKELDEVMKECARRAEKVVNGRRLGGRSPTEEDCT